MEEISKESISISKPMEKEKRARSQKQIEAFKLCAEKRRLKLLEKKQLPSDSSLLAKSNPNINANVRVVPENEYSKLAEEIKILKNQVDDMKQAKQRLAMAMTPINEEESMEIDETPHMSQASPRYNQQYQQQHNQLQRRHGAVGLEYAMHNQQQNSSNASRKRDIRGMDPYTDEKQGMMEKIYSRNVNQMKQQQMDALISNRMIDENSVQLLPSSVNVDRHAPVENMSTMIRSSAFTNNARKQNAVAFNGYRVASRIR